MEIRKATTDDAFLLSELRKAQLIDAGRDPSRNIDKELLTYFKKEIRNGNLIEFLAVKDKEVLGSAALILQEFPPNFPYPTGKVGYICNVYTKPEHRQKGLSKRLVEAVIAQAKDKNLEKLWLLSSVMGRSVYDKLGFTQPGNYYEMDL